MAEFDFGKIFRDSFGYNPPIDQDKVQLEKAVARKEYSDIGQPFYATDISGVEFFLPVWINELLIPFAVIGMTWKKKIVETEMPDRAGSVNELISIADYQFTIRGILIDEKNNYPEKEIIEFHNLFKINSSVVMRSVISDIVLKGKTSERNPIGHAVIITEINWKALAAVEHVKPFELILKSDVSFDLLMNEKGLIGPLQKN